METLIQKVEEYLPSEKVSLIQSALDFAEDVHSGQSRKSGEPFIEHPINVASYLADLSLDATTIIAALLHDVIEDCDVTSDQISEKFGLDVAYLVDGVTKLQKLDLSVNKSRVYANPIPSGQAESLRKMLVAMAEDIRVVIIKLADRLHNMRTLGALKPSKRVSISQETLDIYAPLAHRLGMGEIKWQLEDLAFRYLQPNQYRIISKLLSRKRQEREIYTNNLTEILDQELKLQEIEAEVSGRPKHIYSTYLKAKSYRSQGKQFGDIHDLFAVRVLTKSIRDCYAVLGAVHSLWRPVPGEFDDYIASPKENLYQSLHTTVRAPGGVPIEVQIRTTEMHHFAEYGVASHWRYKESISDKKGSFDQRMAWLRQLIEMQGDLHGAEEFLESVKTDIFNDQVYVYTPKNDIKELPSGATPVDFAYRIHTELGHRCIGSKVNGKLVSLDTVLNNGDTVEILTSKITHGPSLEWLDPNFGYLVSATAKQSVRTWFRKQQHGENINRGKELLEKELRRLNLKITGNDILEIAEVDSEDELYLRIGSGQTSLAQITFKLITHAKDENEEKNLASRISIRPSVSVIGAGNLMIRLGECCRPKPEKKIIGFITRSGEITVHHADCSNVRPDADPARLVEVSWGISKPLDTVTIKVEAADRVGLLHDITGAMSGEGVNIAGSRTDLENNGLVAITLNLQLSSLQQLSKMFSRLEGVRGIKSVTRIDEFQL